MCLKEFCDGPAPIAFADPDCGLCGGDGIVNARDVFVLGGDAEMFPCSCINRVRHAPAVFSDADSDGWIDNVRRVKAKYAGGPLAPDAVEEIVLHDVGRGRGEVIPRYFAHVSDGRYVSAHFVVHWPDYEHALTQCVPITRIAWHAGRANRRSIGIEHDEPNASAPHWPERLLATSFDLVDSLLHLRPSIRRIVAHRALSPKTRSDPRHWPWQQWRERYEPRGVAIVAA